MEDQESQIFLWILLQFTVQTCISHLTTLFYTGLTIIYKSCTNAIIMNLPSAKDSPFCEQGETSIHLFISIEHILGAL